MGARRWTRRRHARATPHVLPRRVACARRVRRRLPIRGRRPARQAAAAALRPCCRAGCLARRATGQPKAGCAPARPQPPWRPQQPPRVRRACAPCASARPPWRRRAGARAARATASRRPRPSAAFVCWRASARRTAAVRAPARARRRSLRPCLEREADGGRCDRAGRCANARANGRCSACGRRATVHTAARSTPWAGGWAGGRAGGWRRCRCDGAARLRELAPEHWLL